MSWSPEGHSLSTLWTRERESHKILIYSLQTIPWLFKAVCSLQTQPHEKRLLGAKWLPKNKLPTSEASNYEDYENRKITTLPMIFKGLSIFFSYFHFFPQKKKWEVTGLFSLSQFPNENILKVTICFPHLPFSVKARFQWGPPPHLLQKWSIKRKMTLKTEV